MLTLDEMERAAYVSGDTSTAALLARIIDLEEEVRAYKYLAEEAKDYVTDEHWKESLAALDDDEE
jgi:hypothetical protein